jgi:hypothetical protein
MKSRLKLLCLGAAVAVTLFVTKPVMADEGNKRTELQFSAPVEIPGRVLTPGKYVFELADSQSDRNIVQVFAEDSNGHESLVSTIPAIPAYRSNIPGKSIVQFEERPSGTPVAIHSWFYPGDKTGWQFVYPKEHQAVSGE